MKKNCQMCGEPFIGKRSDAKYCSNSCKAKYFELRDKKSPPLKNGLSGVSFTNAITNIDINSDEKNIPTPTSESKTKLRNVDIEDLTPFDNIFDEDSAQTKQTTAKGQEPEKKAHSTQEDLNMDFLNGSTQPDPKNSQVILPAKYIEKRVERPNPVYQNNLNRIEYYNVSIKKCHDELSRLNSELKAIEQQTGNGYVMFGIAGGAIISGLISNSENDVSPAKKDNFKNYSRKIAKLKRDTDQTAQGSFLKTLFSLAAGAAVGWVLKQEYNTTNKVSKAQAIRFYQGSIKKITTIKERLSKERDRVIMENAFVKTKLSEYVKVENPDYQKALSLRDQQSFSLGSSDALLSGLQHGPVIDSKNPFADLFNKPSTTTPREINNPLETDKISSIKKVAGMKFQLLNFNGKWLDLFGQPQTNFFCVIHGMSGEGKTNFSIQFAKYLAENFGNVLYISGEEGFAPTFQQKIKELGAGNVTRLYAADMRTGQEILAEVQNKYHFLVIDSVNNMDIDPDMMKAIRNKFRKSGIIAICQSTKDGKIRGSYQIVHDSDIAVKVINGIAITTKNRFKEKNQEFDVFAVYRKPKLTIVKKTGTDDNEDLIFGNTV